MKKTLALLLAVLMLSATALVGCGGGKETESSEPVSQRSIPEVSAPSVNTSTKFTMTVTAAEDWDVSTAAADLCFSAVAMGDEMGRTINGAFKGTIEAGKTLKDYAAAYETETEVTFNDAKWGEPEDVTIGGYPAIKVYGDMGFEGVSNRKEFFCYWVNVDGEIFTIIYQQDKLVDGGEYDMTKVDQMIGSIKFTPIA